MKLDNCSYARTKLHAVFLGTLISGITFFLSKVALISLISFCVFSALSLSVFLIKCENCGVLLYRKSSKHHGLPAIGWQWVDPKCPCCEMKRYGLIDGVAALIGSKNRTPD